MSDLVSWSLRMSVRDGRLDDAKALVAEMVEATRSEPGALIYEYFLGDDGTSCHIYERYTDSDAVMAHLGNFGENFADRFMACFEPTSFSVYGPASADVRDALSAFGVVHLGRLDGFSRYDRIGIRRPE
jgi:quinol monooxygenase YgiN